METRGFSPRSRKKRPAMPIAQMREAVAGFIQKLVRCVFSARAALSSPRFVFRTAA
jgi:hypothetical protein